MHTNIKAFQNNICQFKHKAHIKYAKNTELTGIYEDTTVATVEKDLRRNYACRKKNTREGGV